MEELTVYPAEPYDFSKLGTFGNANYMYWRQFQFPNSYSEKDELVGLDHDRCIQSDDENVEKCLKEYTDGGLNQLGNWLKSEKTKDEVIINFITKILKADTLIKWTGYRVLCTIGGNGHFILRFELFYKHPDSKTEVFTGPNAPNILSGPRKR